MPDAGRLEALARNQQALLSAGGDLEQIFDIIVGQSLAAIPQAHGAIIELLEADRLVYRAASGEARRHLGRRLPVAGSVAGRSIASHTPMLVADLEREAALDLGRYRDVGMRALMTVPFWHGNHSVGALKFYSGEPAAFAALDLTVARLIAGQLIAGLARTTEQTIIRSCRETTGLVEAIPEALPQLVWRMTSAGAPVSYNRRADEFLQFDRLVAAGTGIPSAIGPGLAEAGLRWDRVCADAAPVSIECRLTPTAGAPRWFLVDLAPITGEGRHADEWMAVATDIDDRKTVELALRAEIQSRERLLVEVNHRAKNSLQMISGLLAMHASRIAHPEARSRLMDARSQIGAIAQIHDLLHRARLGDQVELVGLLRGLATNLIDSVAGGRARLRFEAPELLLLPIDRGVPAAMIASEIITNALKHAAAQGGACIAITIARDAHGCSVDIADDGPGLPPGFDPELSDGLGMDIIFGLAAQAGGRVAIDPDHSGARFTLHLPARADG